MQIDVIEIQKVLIYFGYTVGDKGADGKMGINTISAIKQFQFAEGLKGDGIVGAKTAEKIALKVFKWNNNSDFKNFWKKYLPVGFENYPDKSILLNYPNKNEFGFLVYYIQDFLKVLGYSIGSSGVDGKMGINTISAIKKFQVSEKLKSDGIVGKETAEKIKLKIKKEVESNGIKFSVNTIFYWVNYHFFYKKISSKKKKKNSVSENSPSVESYNPVDDNVRENEEKNKKMKFVFGFFIFFIGFILYLVRLKNGREKK